MGLIRVTVEFEIMPKDGSVGDEREALVEGTGHNAFEAVLDALMSVRRQMTETDGFHLIHVGRQVEL